MLNIPELVRPAPSDKPVDAPRRTFAIISHPDAGKTTLTEKLLQFGGAIQMAGQVRARGNLTIINGATATGFKLELAKSAHAGIIVNDKINVKPHQSNSLPPQATVLV